MRLPDNPSHPLVDRYQVRQGVRMPCDIPHENRLPSDEFVYERARKCARDTPLTIEPTGRLQPIQLAKLPPALPPASPLKAISH